MVLERTIGKTQGSFIACGNALAEIRDSKLYRSTHKTFEAYCSDVWGWSRQRAYQLIDAAELRAALPEKCQPGLTNEKQLRALKSVPKEKRAKIIESGATTTQEIKVAAQIQDKDYKDERGHDIPKSLKEDWMSACIVGNTIRQSGRAFKKVVDDYLAIGDKFKQKHNLADQMSKDIGELVSEMSVAIPYAVCPFCHGKGCEKCHSRGWVSKLYWNQFVPVKYKNNGQ